MSIILDPNKNFISFETYYVEERKTHGNIVFHFINSPLELDEWKSKGYQLKDPSKPINAKIISKLTTWWRRMTWKEQNVIFSKSLRQMAGTDGKLTTDLDMIRYRDLKLKSCLKKWDLVDEQNNPIPISDDIVDSLDPTVAAELINTFERITEATEDEKKTD